MDQNNPFKWRHYESCIILLCVRWYCRYCLSYRDLEEMMNDETYIKIKGVWHYLYRAIYPIGYFLGYMSGSETTDFGTVNIIYNIADLVNKTAFGLAIWIGATMDSSK